MPPDTIAALLETATRRLAAAGCDTPQLDARLLLQSAAGITREDIILAPDRAVGNDDAATFEGYVARRACREPVSRILAEREFYGRRFRVTQDVLDPRPDTETLVDAALRVMPRGAGILDLGTGSGAIIVTLLAERPDTTGIATDLNDAAIAVATANATALGVMDRLQLLHGSWFDPVTGQFDVIVANPPYIPHGEIAGLAPDVREFDPLSALTDGGDGLGAYRAIAAKAAAHLRPGGTVLVEIGAGQSGGVEMIFVAAGFHPSGRYVDLGGHVRCLAFCQP